jgi:hypothetical protein
VRVAPRRHRRRHQVDHPVGMTLVVSCSGWPAAPWRRDCLPPLFGVAATICLRFSVRPS